MRSRLLPLLLVGCVAALALLPSATATTAPAVQMTIKVNVNDSRHHGCRGTRRDAAGRPTSSSGTRARSRTRSTSADFSPGRSPREEEDGQRLARGARHVPVQGPRPEARNEEVPRASSGSSSGRASRVVHRAAFGASIGACRGSRLPWRRLPSRSGLAAAERRPREHPRGDGLADHAGLGRAPRRALAVPNPRPGHRLRPADGDARRGRADRVPADVEVRRRRARPAHRPGAVVAQHHGAERRAERRRRRRRTGLRSDGHHRVRARRPHGEGPLGAAPRE